MDILTYGQKELKDVINQLEEQLKTVVIPYQQIENNKKSTKKIHKSETKLNDSEVYNHPKKQRVDKNKCRKCKLSTIPTILHLLQQNDSTDANSFMTMKSIRQQIAQQSQKKEEQSDSKIPYIAFDYSHQIAICKRCRFKFHSECVQIQGALNEWLCDYCLTRIEELKNSNLWDYKNQKQIKLLPNLASEQKKINIKILERIQKKKQIFIISEIKPTPNKQFNQISQFLQKYPLYKSSTRNITYPILETLAVDYPEVLNIKQKPKPHMIKSKIIEQILKIYTIQQIILPNSKPPENFTQEYIEKNFYDILINLFTQYFDEFILSDDLQFQHYCDQANAYTTSYLYLMNYLILNSEDKNQDLLKKTWKECVLQIDQVINYNNNSKIGKLDFDNLQFQDQICILSILSEGLYDLDKMKDLIKDKDQIFNKENINQCQLTQSNLQILLQSNYSLFINGGTYLGQDAHEQQYFYFTFFPSAIYVETKNGWGQYTISDLTELISSLNQQGINELGLLENLEQIKQIELFDLSTPIKQKNKLIQKQQYQLDILEVIDKFLIIEESYTQLLQKKNLYWISNNEKNSFFNLIKNQDNIKSILSALNQFFNGLIQPISKIGIVVQPFKIFKFHFVLINQLAIYVENANSLSNIYISLLVLERVLNDKEQYMKQKEQMKIIVQKVKNKKVIKEEKKKQQKIQKYKQDEDYQDVIQRNKKQVQKISNNQNSRASRRNNSLKQITCFSCQKILQNSDSSEICPRCQQVFHKECLQQNKSLCQRCFQKKNRRFK